MIFSEIFDLGWHQMTSRLLFLKGLCEEPHFDVYFTRFQLSSTFDLSRDSWPSMTSGDLETSFSLMSSRASFWYTIFNRDGHEKVNTGKDFTSKILRKWLPKVHLSFSDLLKVNFCFPRYAYLQVIFSIAELIGGFGLIFQINDQKPIFNSSKI